MLLIFRNSLIPASIIAIIKLIALYYIMSWFSIIWKLDNYNT